MRDASGANEDGARPRPATGLAIFYRESIRSAKIRGTMLAKSGDATHLDAGTGSLQGEGRRLTT